MRVLGVFGYEFLPADWHLQPMRVSARTLDSLARQYQDAGLPLPPANAPLVQIFSGGFGQDANDKHGPRFCLGFELKAREANSNAGSYLVGTETYVPEPPSRYERFSAKAFDPAGPLPFNLEIEPLPFHGSKFPVNSWLALAIQCHLRGHRKLVKQIFKRGLARDLNFRGPAFVTTGQKWMEHNGTNPSIAELFGKYDIRLSLAATTWNHYVNAAMQPGSDHAAILPRMEKLLADHPPLRGEQQLNFVESLRLTLQPSTSAPGTVEALIDALIECATPGGRHALKTGATDPNYAKLELMGFDAVPTLISHMGDRRLSRSITMGFNNFPNLPRYVGEVVCDLIEDLAKPELGDDWLPRQLGEFTDAELVHQWWEKARAVGEEEYVCSHIFPSQKGERDTLNTACLHIVAARYPQRLGEIYQRLLAQRPDIGSVEFTRTIATTENLDREEKLRLLRAGAEAASLAHREDALRELFKLDRPEAENRLAAELDKLPADSTVSYCFSPEAAISYLVMETESPAVWEAFTRATRRAAVGLRLQLMKIRPYSFMGDKHLAQRLAYLAAFLDDETVRFIDKSAQFRRMQERLEKMSTSDAAAPDDDLDKYEGPCAAFTFPEIAVRDFAAMQIGSILRIPSHPDKDWSPAQWAEYRASIRATLAARQI